MSKSFDLVTEIIECESITTQLRSNSSFSFKKKGYIRLIRDYIRRSYVLEFFPYIKDKPPNAQKPCISLNISLKELQNGKIQYKQGCRISIIVLHEGVCYIEISNEQNAKLFQEKIQKCLEDPNILDETLIIIDKNQNMAKKPKISNFEIKSETVKITKDDFLLDMYKIEEVKPEVKAEPKPIRQEAPPEPLIVSKKFYSSSDKPKEVTFDLEIREEVLPKKSTMTPKHTVKRKISDVNDENEKVKEKVITPKRNILNENTKFIRTTPSMNTRAMKRLNMTPSNQENQENNFDFDDDLLKSPVKTWNRNNSRTFLKGFSNLGNTCYMNSILQCLLNIDIFSFELLKNYDKIKKHQLKCLTIDTTNDNLNEDQLLLLDIEQNYLYNCLCELVKAREYHNEDLKLKSLRDIKSAISKEATRFSGYQQHDAHEFLCQILDQLKDEAIKLSKQNQSTQLTNPVVDNYEFQVTHAIECKTCGNTIMNYEEYNNLCLELPESFKNSLDDQKNFSIQNALDIFFKDEVLTDFKCEKCSTRGDNLIKRKFVRLPRVLILHLKRYQFKEVTEEPKQDDDFSLDEPPKRQPTYKLVKNESSILIPRDLQLSHLLTSDNLQLPRPVDQDILEMSQKTDEPQPITPLKSHIETRSNTPKDRPALGKLTFNSPVVKSIKFDDKPNFLTPNNLTRRPFESLRTNSVGKNVKYLDGMFDFEDKKPRVDLSKKFDEETRKAMELSLATYKSQIYVDDAMSDLIEDPFSDDLPKKIESKSDENSYRIIGIVNHLGSSSNSGHYISDVLNMKTKRWSSFDDSQVESINEDEVFSSRVKTGYIFFYVHNSLIKD